MEGRHEATIHRNSQIQLTKNGANQAIERIENEVQKGTMTIQKALAGRQISEYKRVLGMWELGTKITHWICQLSNAYNINGRITTEQAADIADVIMKDFWYLKLAELALFFNQAKSGKFGKVYDRLDQAVIVEWLNNYCGNERSDELEKKHQSQKGQLPTQDILNKLFKPAELMLKKEREEQMKQTTEESRNRKNLLIQYQKLNDWFPREIEQIELTIIRWHERRVGMGYEVKHVALEQFIKYRKIQNLIEKLNNTRR